MSSPLSSLRQTMADHHIDYYYVPTRDDHNNEYVPPHWQRRTFLTGFTGSYGQALVGLEHAYLWTDPRYYLQADDELNPTEFQLMKQVQGQEAPISSWLATHAKHCVVGVDPAVMSMHEHKVWADSLEKTGGKLKAIPENLVDAIWHDRPKLTLSQLRLLPEKYTGDSSQHKISRVRAAMKEAGANALIVSMLDEIAWLFNVRANDIPFNPLLISYAIVTEKDAVLFTALDRVSADAKKQLNTQGIHIHPYDEFAGAAKKLKGAVWVDPASTSWWIESLLQNVNLIERASPIVMMKAIKNEVELAGAQEAHRLDALAVVKFLHWLDSHWQNGLTEITAADQLEKFRREDSRCVDLSFPTICGFADRGAIVHYQAHPETTRTIDDSNILLVDSGGQYYEGTTDITRTLHLGVPTDEQKKHYTLVLKGHLALRHAVFPDGICGEQVNAIARLPLWSHGLDFGHGTGHGVGAYLCVHEGPQRIAYGYTNVPLVPGMIVSNEPGFYLTGHYGIRIENLCAITLAYEEADSLTGSGPFYTMEDLTLVPYARNLIDKSMLSQQEIGWVNAYHQRVYDALIDDLSGDAKDWLQAATQAL